METYCTRPSCPRPHNIFPDLDNRNVLKTVQQKFCTTCGMPQILIGRYMPIKMLGRGGFGAAFLAVDRYTPTMRHCVVKQFLPSGNLSPDQLELAQKLFEREAEALENLGNPHPQIPDLLAFFELEVPSTTSHQPSQFFYLVQEFIDGQNMEEILEQKGKFSEAETLEVLGEVLNILKFVHENGSIHRDIKPSNIMRDRQGRIHLLDFGAVKQVTSAQGAGSKGSTGIYSMGFAPPEQMSGGVVYPATDLYALGVTCITLLTGKQPMELFDAYSNSWNWRAYVQVDDLLEAVLNRMLQPTPSARFQSADEVMSALRGRSPSPQAAPASASTRVPPGRVAAKASSPPPPPPVSSPPPPPARQPPPPPPATPPASSPPAVTPSPPPSARPVARRIPSTPPPSPSIFDDTLALIAGAYFLGFEVSLLAIAVLSIVGISPISWIILGSIAVGLGILLVLRIVEKMDLVIFAVLSLLIAIAIEVFGNFAIVQTAASPFLLLVLIPIMGGLLLVAAAIVFLLIYRLLGLFL